MNENKRGFALLPPDKRRKLAAKGGRAKVKKGFAMFSHEKLLNASAKGNLGRHGHTSEAKTL